MRINFELPYGLGKVDFTLNNDVTVISGVNGSGKTLLLQHIRKLFPIQKQVYISIDPDIEDYSMLLWYLNRKSFYPVDTTLFEEVLNDLVKDTNKTFKIKEGLNVFNYGTQTGAYELSSGEKKMVTILLYALISKYEKTPVILDNPDCYLHFDWQRNLINNILKINTDCQVIISTHSPAIISNTWVDKVFDMKDITSKQ